MKGLQKCSKFCLSLGTLLIILVLLAVIFCTDSTYSFQTFRAIRQNSTSYPTQSSSSILPLAISLKRNGNESDQDEAARLLGHVQLSIQNITEDPIIGKISSNSSLISLTECSSDSFIPSQISSNTTLACPVGVSESFHPNSIVRIIIHKCAAPTQCLAPSTQYTLSILFRQTIIDTSDNLNYPIKLSQSVTSWRNSISIEETTTHAQDISVEEVIESTVSSSSIIPGNYHETITSQNQLYSMSNSPTSLPIEIDSNIVIIQDIVLSKYLTKYQKVYQNTILSYLQKLSLAFPPIILIILAIYNILKMEENFEQVKEITQLIFAQNGNGSHCSTGFVKYQVQKFENMLLNSFFRKSIENRNFKQLEISTNYMNSVNSELVQVQVHRDLQKIKALLLSNQKLNQLFDFKLRIPIKMPHQHSNEQGCDSFIEGKDDESLSQEEEQISQEWIQNIEKYILKRIQDLEESPLKDRNKNKCIRTNHDVQNPSSKNTTLDVLQLHKFNKSNSLQANDIEAKRRSPDSHCQSKNPFSPRQNSSLVLNKQSFEAAIPFQQQLYGMNLLPNKRDLLMFTPGSMSPSISIKQSNIVSQPCELDGFKTPTCDRSSFEQHQRDSNSIEQGERGGQFNNGINIANGRAAEESSSTSNVLVDFTTYQQFIVNDMIRQQEEKLTLSASKKRSNSFTAFKSTNLSGSFNLQVELLRASSRNQTMNTILPELPNRPHRSTTFSERAIRFSQGGPTKNTILFQPNETSNVSANKGSKASDISPDKQFSNPRPQSNQGLALSIDFENERYQSTTKN